jgi:hypothetical protein
MGVAQVARDLKTQSCPIAQIASRLHDACSLVFFLVFDLGEQVAAQLPSMSSAPKQKELVVEARCWFWSQLL